MFWSFFLINYKLVFKKYSNKLEMNSKNPWNLFSILHVSRHSREKKTEQIPGKSESQACSTSSMELNPTTFSP